MEEKQRTYTTCTNKYQLLGKIKNNAKKITRKIFTWAHIAVSCAMRMELLWGI
ncbi:hypothetical protein [uncultured Dysosmobacter sp.]|uniref:hypothetical protein n=1 Tax=uncultured Dysosmobacter sp. TaxID=2591384 RepID=UPI00260B52A0|nr:hypothetical protein [uncultured Dysosmobacter sp.]